MESSVVTMLRKWIYYNNNARGIERYSGERFLNEEQTGWDMEVVQDICNERDSRLIQQIPFPMLAKEDSWLWLLEDNGQFSVKSCYRRIRGDKVHAEGAFWRKL